MSLQDKKEGIESQEKRASSAEESARFEQGKEKVLERETMSVEDKMVSAELRREIEMMELGDDKSKEEAKQKAKKIEFLGEKEKIEHLIETAREKGLVFAIQVAKRMNEPYLLDILHDTLAQEGFYKDFTK